MCRSTGVGKCGGRGEAPSGGSVSQSRSLAGGGIEWAGRRKRESDHRRHGHARYWRRIVVKRRRDTTGKSSDKIGNVDASHSRQHRVEEASELVRVARAALELDEVDAASFRGASDHRVVGRRARLGVRVRVRGMANVLLGGEEDVDPERYEGNVLRVLSLQAATSFDKTRWSSSAPAF